MKKLILTIIMMFCIMLTVSCSNADDNTYSAFSDDVSNIEVDIPSDGIIPKETFDKIAGTNKTLYCNKEDENDISYTWVFNGEDIVNSQEQNLLIEFESDNLEEKKSEADNATVALKLTLHNENLICPCNLIIKLNSKWDEKKVLLLKEQNSRLAKVSDVTIDTDDKTTTLSMTLPISYGEFYLMGGEEESELSAGKSDDNASSDEITDSDGGAAESDNKNETSDSSNESKDYSDSDNKDVQTCSISIDCKSVLNNMDSLNAAKKKYIPKDGVILDIDNFEFEANESVFDILKRACKENGIAMEYSSSITYNTAYVEGIGQLYEFDCGSLSGWEYCVNGYYPNYGCAEYKVEDKDVIKWRYTCNLGEDL